MQFYSDDIKQKSKLIDLENHRNEILKTYKEAIKLSEKMQSSFDVLKSDKDILSAHTDFFTEYELDENIQKVDSFLWDLSLKESGVFNIVSGDLKERLLSKYNYYKIESIRKRIVCDYEKKTKYDVNVPEFTANDVEIVLKEIFNNLGNIRRASIVETYQKLQDASFRKSGSRNWNDRSYQSSDKINKKMRFNHFSDLSSEKYPSIYSWYSRSKCDLFGDLENTFRMIEGRPNLGIENRISKTMESTFSKLRYSETSFPVKFEGDYFNLDIFKRGSVLLTFTKEKVLEEFNKIANNGTKIANKAK